MIKDLFTKLKMIVYSHETLLSKKRSHSIIEPHTFVFYYYFHQRYLPQLNHRLHYQQVNLQFLPLNTKKMNLFSNWIEMKWTFPLQIGREQKSKKGAAYLDVEMWSNVIE